MKRIYHITQMVRHAAEYYPKDIAFSDSEFRITFQELYDVGRCLGTLIYEKNSERQPVAFYMEKGVPAVKGIIGTLFAGAAYSFIDVRQPMERAEKTLQILDPAIVITDRKTAEKGRLPGFGDGCILLEDMLQTASQLPAERLLEKGQIDYTDTDPLYINFTSGSTGIPKGVVVSHRSVIDFISIFTEIFGIGQADVIGNQAPFDFDVSVKDIYSGIFAGAEVRIISRDFFSEPMRLMDEICEHRVTVLIWSVSALCIVSTMHGFSYRKPERLRMVMFSGEVIPMKHLVYWRQELPFVRFINLYGPTEITCNCTYYELPLDGELPDDLPIGVPFPNEKVFLVDEKDHEILKTEEGKVGEICVGGSCLALGYYKDPAKTSEVFTQNPRNAAFLESIYRIGDLGKYDAEQKLHFVSRKDFQIKHFGHRIELGEIERNADSLNNVDRSCCLYDANLQKITLFYVGEIKKKDVRLALKERLPVYMIPAKLVHLMDMPISKNGKINRTALAKGEYTAIG